ncbi:hypothetical protein LTR37_007743 [Vermiconidia calcicola]|uniref:Uncharacterized protein n=1 Tax=Vermiconidia calcicola TaxID=1690605 RepID=A0ACC3ND15_9PEZI|nr:hypothetical protein LTR37_007743 [Vermiconidia calcicola]
MSDQQPLLRPTTSPHTHSEQNQDSIITTTRQQTRRYLSSKTGHYSVLLLVSLDVSCIFADFIFQIFSCEGRVDSHDGEIVLDALGIVSLVFSCLFMTELVASVWAFGFGYFRSKFHCFDALVITAGLVIDVLLRGVLEEVASLVIVLRLWRVFKIIEELSVGAEEQMEDLQERLEMLEREKTELTKEVEKLTARLGNGSS